MKEVHSNVTMYCDAMICTHSKIITHCDITMDVLVTSLPIVMSQRTSLTTSLPIVMS